MKIVRRSSPHCHLVNSPGVAFLAILTLIELSGGAQTQKQPEKDPSMPKKHVVFPSMRADLPLS